MNKTAWLDRIEQKLGITRSAAVDCYMELVEARLQGLDTSDDEMVALLHNHVGLLPQDAREFVAAYRIRGQG